MATIPFSLVDIHVLVAMAHHNHTFWSVGMQAENLLGNLCGRVDLYLEGRRYRFAGEVRDIQLLNCTGIFL